VLLPADLINGKAALHADLEPGVVAIRRIMNVGDGVDPKVIPLPERVGSGHQNADALPDIESEILLVHIQNNVSDFIFRFLGSDTERLLYRRRVSIVYVIII
jgi:hypothetical protein